MLHHEFLTYMYLKILHFPDIGW